MELPAGWLVVLTTVTPSLLIAYRYSLLRHYFQEGGTLDACIEAEGKRFSRGVLQG
jgi:hypothetical protein